MKKKDIFKVVNDPKMLSHLPDQEDDLLKILVYLERLCRVTEAEFPDARAFVRAGFDKK
jgi:hypothetical protein